MDAIRIGVDIGGTFTDITIMTPDGGIVTKKVSSTADNYARAIGEGLQSAFAEHGFSGAQVGELLHGTTVASNAILERKGARTGLITTKGFRDVLELRSLRMPRLYDLTWEKPPMLVDRRLRLEVDERVNARGEVERPLDLAEVEAVVSRLLAEDVEAISVCLLHSYANAVHERMIRDLVRRMAPDMVLSISSEVLPEIKEYERTSTTVINAYVKPVVSRYLRALEADLTRVGIRAPLLLMQSNGGLTPAAVAAEMPMNIVESGPAAGVIGAQALARRSGFDRVISFDMGGTTAKAALIENGEVARADEYSVGGGIMIGSRLMSGAGYVLKVPAIDLAEVGAGGGSIISIDAGGAPQVGPESAGSFPGPVCYGLGGTEPTVTDANVVLGYINPAYLAGGTVKLDAAQSRSALAGIAGQLGLSLERTAHGAHLIAAANMIRAIKAVSSERGRDPRDFALVAFGGNGPLFAANMARSLGIRTVIVPPSAGVFSSVGLLHSNVEYHLPRTFRQVTRTVDLEALAAALSALETQAREKLAADGFAPGQMRLRRFAKLHYRGQAFELTVKVPDGPVDAETPALLDLAFADEHERTYGHRAGPDEPVELVSLNLVAAAEPKVADGARPRPPETHSGPPRERAAYFGPDYGWMPTPVVTRGHLVGAGLAGPLVVEEYDCTCVVLPNMTARLDADGNITIDTGADRPSGHEAPTHG